MYNHLKTTFKKQNFKKRKNNFLRKVLLLSILSINSITYAQEEKQLSQIKGNNELKINGLYLVAEVIDITYERLINDRSAIGISSSVALNDTFYDFVAMPYFRLYWGEKRAAGFFIEANGAVLHDDFQNEISLFGDNNSNPPGDPETRFGLGLGIGGKFISKDGWIGEISYSFGRIIGEDNFFEKFYGRLGITLGKRF